MSIYPSPAIGPSILWLSACSSPIPYESPVMTAREWDRQRKAEAGAKIEEPDSRRYPLCQCYLCGVMIGPGYLAYELYLCHIIDQKVYDKNDRHIYIDDAWIETCHSCAHRKQRESVFAFGVQHIEPSDYEATKRAVQIQLSSLYRTLQLPASAPSPSLQHVSLPKMCPSLVSLSPDTSTTPGPKKKLSLRGYEIQSRLSSPSAIIAI